MFRFRLLSFVLLLCFSASQAEEVPTLVRVVVPEPGAVNVRAEPSPQSKKLAALKNGEFVANIGCVVSSTTGVGSSSSWCKVRVPPRSGWVQKKFLSQQEGQSEYEVVSVPDEAGVDVKREPFSSSEADFLFPLGASGILITKCDYVNGETWCNVFTNRIDGWVSSTYLDLQQPEIEADERQVDWRALYGDWSLTKGCKEGFTRYSATPEWIGVAPKQGSFKEYGRDGVRIDRTRNEVCLAAGYEYVTCGNPIVLNRRFFKARWTEVTLDEGVKPDEAISTQYRCPRLPSDEDAGRPRSLPEVEIPAVGCPYHSMAFDPEPAPILPPVRIRLRPDVAGKLAYYRASQGPSILAPRGWSCLGSSGTGGGGLLVMPTLNQIERFRKSGGSGSKSGQEFPEAVMVSSVHDDGSGWHAVGRRTAMLFPHLSKGGNKWEDFEGKVRAESFPNDYVVKLNRPSVVEFETPAGAVGAGTVLSDLAPTSDPIIGAAVLSKAGSTTSVASVAVRLSPNNVGLASSIIEYFELANDTPKSIRTEEVSPVVSPVPGAPVTERTMDSSPLSEVLSFVSAVGATPIGLVVILVALFVVGLVVTLRPASGVLTRTVGLFMVIAVIAFLIWQTERISNGLQGVGGHAVAIFMILSACIVAIWLGVSGRIQGRLRTNAISVSVLLVVMIAALHLDLDFSSWPTARSPADREGALDNDDHFQLKAWYSLVCQQQVHAEICPRIPGVSCREHQFKVERDLRILEAKVVGSHSIEKLEGLRASAKTDGARIVENTRSTVESMNSLPGNQGYEFTFSPTNIKENCDMFAGSRLDP